ncbi:hypothetical protein CASFOL_025048 [Castilleja foliolosa]|uniref:Uncharacterized protein n=1 Tax=Castilleja foliolosa TaxID=1961234 RepID=A0ABD3CSA3_9LAMI
MRRCESGGTFSAMATFVRHHFGEDPLLDDEESR